MDFLWKRESNNNGLYVDIFKSVPDSTKIKCKILMETFKANKEFHLLGKDNTKSLEFRNVGNEHFKKKNWALAMTWYNKSLCFAENGTENVSLAYANRSSCFLQLNMYAKCLVDIEFAIKANYPKHLMPKLSQRRMKCAELIQNGSPDESEYYNPSLSYEANSKFLEMVNVLEIKENKEFGRFVVATSDIPAGKTILIEKSFTSLPSNRDHCYVCLNTSMNFVPCENCSWAVFCHHTCTNERDLHRMECGESLYELQESEKEDYFTWESEEGTAGIECGMFYKGIDHLKHSFLDVLKSFSSTKSLIKFVEDAIETETYKIPHELSDMKSKYRGLLQLSRLPKQGPVYLQEAYFAFNYLMLRNDIKEKFDTEQKKRFLMNLLLHQKSVIGSNGFNTHDGRSDAYILFSYFNHSCTPNVLSRSRANMRFAFTLRPIKAGHQLFISYLSDVYGDISVPETKRRIYKNFGFQCRRCERCQPNESLRQQNSFLLQLDSKCQWLELHWEQINSLDEEKRKMMREITIGILNKYGGSHWCAELARIMEIYDDLILWLLGAHKT